MSRISTHSRIALAVAAAVAPAAVAVAGCGASSPAAGAGGTSGTDRQAVGTGTPSPAVKVPKYQASENARKDVTASACVHDGAKGWEARGIATNTSSSRRGYSIVIDFVTPKGDTVMDTKLVRVKPVAPRSSAHWSVTGAAGQRKILCVIRQALVRS
jgi:hypothetical protein